MNNYLLLFLLLLPLNVFAETCSIEDGPPVDDCHIADIDGNLIVKWAFATERDICPDDAPPECIDNQPLHLDEIKSTKVYFHEVAQNNWKDLQVPNQYVAVKIKLAAGNYEIFATTIDTDSRESAPSNIITKIIDDVVNEFFTLPKAPTVIEVESARSNIIRVLIE